MAYRDTVDDDVVDAAGARAQRGGRCRPEDRARGAPVRGRAPPNRARRRLLRADGERASIGQLEQRGGLAGELVHPGFERHQFAGRGSTSPGSRRATSRRTTGRRARPHRTGRARHRATSTVRPTRPGRRWRTSTPNVVCEVVGEREIAHDFDRIACPDSRASCSTDTPLHCGAERLSSTVKCDQRMLRYWPLSVSAHARARHAGRRYAARWRSADRWPSSRPTPGPS